ncbi:MAG: carbamate kinase [Candidatus Neomarinimicrobiota bacterium]|nr:carbamate kinase [Candidatus Neomarinimicrobiota bacterium]
MKNPTVMVALGGNSLSPKGKTISIEDQFSRARKTMDGLSNFIDLNYNICITHGNGPQVGNELLRMDLTNEQVPPLSLGVCVANTQGQMGYMIQQTLQNKLRDMNIDREVVSLVTQVIVDKNDESINNPTKYIGPRYSKKDIRPLSNKFNWKIKEQEPGIWRRVVPSPMPDYIMHGKSIKALVDRGTIVIAFGGGGIPVYNDDKHKIEGLDAVIDKDYSAAKMGRIIRAQELWIISDIEYLYRNFGEENQTPYKEISFQDLISLYKNNSFQEGTIKPKIKAAIHFLKHHGEKVVITSINNIQNALNDQLGTIIRK